MRIQTLQALRHLCPATGYGSSFSRGLRLEFRGATVLLISGTAAIGVNGESLHPHDVAAQTRRALENIEALLADAGMNWHDVVWTNCYLKGMADYRLFNQERTRFYATRNLDPLPASVCVQATLCRPELLVEISAIAAKES
jgi:enamine deaminase RidA (YjgF/YER057c/UK114 family)